MFADIVDLRDFYKTPLGGVAGRLLAAQARDVWGGVRGEQIAGLGYASPLLEGWRAEAAAVYALMPARQGAVFWPADAANLACLVKTHQLPLPDASLDRVVALHALEGVSDPSPLLREAWRVLKGGGRFLAIVPNRRGVWAHSDHTPFGMGQPYSTSQIKRALREQGFAIEDVRGALYALPSAARMNLALADRTERWGQRLFTRFGGVWMIDTRKVLGAPVKTVERKRPRLILPVPLPSAPAMRG